MAEQAFISIGSNIDPQRNLPLAVEQLAAVGELVAVSRVYQNPAVPSTVQPDFLNAAVLIQTDLLPAQVKRRLNEIETQMGRVRTADPNAARTIDLDLCLYGDRVEQTEELMLPHPDLENYPFVAVPMAELAPAYRHPVLRVSLAELAGGMAGDEVLTRRPDVVLPGLGA